MTRSERRLFFHSAILGVALTLVVLLLDGAGMLTALELYFYDLRARQCQYFTAPPTNKLVHLDVDDRSLEVIGRWPWPRGKVAEIIDELGIAGAKALALDVIFSEPQPPELQPIDGEADVPGPAAPATAPATRPATGPAEPKIIPARAFDHDAALAQALARFGNAVVPVALGISLRQEGSPLYRAVIAELVLDVEVERDQVIQRLAAKGFKQAELAAQLTGLDFINARREAVYERVSAELSKGPASIDELRARILPRTGPHVTNAPLLRILEGQAARYYAVQSLRRFGRPFSPEVPPLLSSSDEQATLRRLIDAAASSGFIDYVPLGDGTVRTVPLWAGHRGFMYPQMGLSLACAMVGVNPKNLRIESRRIVIPKPDGTELAIPVRYQDTLRGQFGLFIDIPWFGASGGANDWQTMYDYPEHQSFRQHMPIHYVWEACELRRRIASNVANMDDALIFLLTEVDLTRAQQLAAHPLAPEDIESRLKLVEQTLAKLKSDGTVEFYEAMKPEDLQPEERVRREKILRTPGPLAELATQTRGLVQDLAQRRASLRQQLEGNAVLIGYVAVGLIADYIPTSLHPRCPGVVVHGVVFNSIMTGDFWRNAPHWITAVLTAFMGLLTAFIVAWLSPWKALAAATVLSLGYLLFNGVYLFDAHNLIVGVAGPMTAVAAVWSGGTLARYILEASERTRATNYFRNYVDPVLVTYVLESDNPRLDGQEKELSVVFTDLAGFTTLSEALKEKTVPLLNDYMGQMVPIVRKHRGTLNKLLGDGIMYFFAAPLDNPRHAVDAVDSALEMQETLSRFNQSLQERDLPTVALRVGISSGHMVVGNCGPADRTFSDYTVLGDTVNLGSRLEGANKLFGSRILVNQRCRELVGDEVLFRPMGRIQVVGKREGVMTYEALSRMELATDEQKRLAELTAAVVESFMLGRFDKCMEAIAVHEQEFGHGKFAKLYRGQCERYIAEPPSASFDGQIVLSEK